jgi:hypothetical protein
MTRPVKVDPDRAALMECEACGKRFGDRGRQKGYEFEEGIKWELDDKRLRCPICNSNRIKLAGS